MFNKIDWSHTDKTYRHGKGITAWLRTLEKGEAFEATEGERNTIQKCGAAIGMKIIARKNHETKKIDFLVEKAAEDSLVRAIRRTHTKPGTKSETNCTYEHIITALKEVGIEAKVTKTKCGLGYAIERIA